MKPRKVFPEVENKTIEKVDENCFPEIPVSNIFSLDDRPYFPLDIPQWKCRVWIRELDVATQTMIAGSSRNEKGDLNSVDYGAKLCLEGVFESDGKGGFKKKFDPTHFDLLKTRNQAAVGLMVQAIGRGPTKKN